MEIKASLDSANSALKSKILKNLPIQKSFLIGPKKSEKALAEKIINDPDLAQIISPPISKDEDQQKIDKGTQMSDREDCSCSRKSLLNACNQTMDETVELKESQTSESKRIFQSINEATFSSSRYQSPLFKACGLTSQVFKQRINLRVMKMSSFSVSKY